MFNIKNEINLFAQKLKRHKINFEKRGDRIIIKTATTDYQQLLVYFLLPLIFGSIIVLSVSLFIIFYGVYIPKMQLLFGFGLVSGFALIGFAYGSLLRIRKKKKENHASKILYNRKLIFKVNQKEKKYDVENIATIKNSIEIHGDSILMGNVFLEDKEGNQVTIISIEGFKSNHLRSDLVWFENFFKNYLQLTT
ncbi:MAG: hypothetical protein AB8B65_12440 [Kordia sp.]|uniref:hypothetical protein n=1 Tax=Kordia sp. TaxID=1965332 RepID=UPI00385A919A